MQTSFCRLLDKLSQLTTKVSRENLLFDLLVRLFVEYLMIISIYIY